MNEVLLANVFFIITGAAVLVVTAFVCIACYHVIRVARITRGMLKKAEQSAESVASDTRAFFENVANGNIFGTILATISDILGRSGQRRGRQHTKRGIINEERE